MSRTIKTTPAHALATHARRASIPNDWRAVLAKREQMRAARHSREARRPAHTVRGFIAPRVLFALTSGAAIACGVFRMFAHVSASLVALVS